MNKGEDNYIESLEKTIQSFLAPVKDIPFPIAIKVLSGYKLLAFDKNSENNKKTLNFIIKAVTIAGREANKDGIKASRANEVGNKVEPYVKKALNAVGLKAETPVAKSGRRKATGYPDIEITDSIKGTVYLECKTYNIKNVDTTQRSFYFSPAKDFKVTKDAFHLLLAYQIESQERKSGKVFAPKHWRLYTLENLTVDIKHEFNQSNRNLYNNKSLLAEGNI